MEDLLEIVNDLRVGPAIPNNPAAPHPRFTGIKARKPCDQQKRRALLLAEQKRRRADLVNSARDLSEKCLTYDDDPPAKKRSWSSATGSELVHSESEADEPSNKYRKQPYWKRNNSGVKSTCKNILMLSEWLVDVPEDLKENWYMVPCPEGKRCVVTTTCRKDRFSTSAFSRRGFTILSHFKSRLPKNTMLDCIWSPGKSTLYVMDVLKWNGMSVTECETEFRFSWLQGKFSEMEDISLQSSDNLFVFFLLPFYPCTDVSISEVMSHYPTFPNDVPRLDGLLFYHGRTHYDSGHTPLVGWLKPYMLPEVLGISVAEEYMMTLALPKQKIRKQHDHQTTANKQLLGLPPCKSETMESEILEPVIELAGKFELSSSNHCESETMESEKHEPTVEHICKFELSSSHPCESETMESEKDEPTIEHT